MATDGMIIATPHNAQQLTNPVHVKAVDAAFTSRQTTIKIFDHDLTGIGQTTITH